MYQIRYMQEIPNTKYQIPNTNPEYIPLAEAGHILNTSRDYMNVLVRRGKLRAIKLGRNWVTTNEWINVYQKSVGRAVLKSEFRSPTSGDLEVGLLAEEKDELKILKSSLILERERALEAKALTPEIKISSRELQTEERKNILEMVQGQFRIIDGEALVKASKRLGILKSLRQRSGLKFAAASGMILILLIATLSFSGLNISRFQDFEVSLLRQGYGEQVKYEAAIFSDVLKNFPNDIPLFSKWLADSVSGSLVFLKSKAPSELIVGELPKGEPKISKPGETLPRVDTFAEAEELDLSAEALA